MDELTILLIILGIIGLIGAPGLITGNIIQKDNIFKIDYEGTQIRLHYQLF